MDVVFTYAGPLKKNSGQTIPIEISEYRDSEYPFRAFSPSERLTQNLDKNAWSSRPLLWNTNMTEFKTKVLGWNCFVV